MQQSFTSPPSERKATPIRILQIGMGWLPEQPGNGLDRVFHALTKTLPDMEVTVNGLVAGSEDVQPTSGQAVSAFAPSNAPLVKRLYRVRRAVQNRASGDSIDVVASHFALYTAPVLDIVHNLPLVVHFHGPWALESQTEGSSSLRMTVKKWIETFVYRRADRCIVLSEAFRDLLNTTYGVPRERIRVVPGGVDVEAFAVDESPSAARAQLGWPQDRPIVLSVRRLANRMGLDHLIDCIASVRRRVPNVLVHIAGTGPLRETLKTRIKSRDLAENVRLLGFVPDGDLALAYRAADVSIVPSIKLEGFGLITVESLAAGTPVLVTPVGGLPETVAPLSENLVLESCEPRALADGLTRALVAPESLPSAEDCRQYARAHHDWSVIASRTRRVYEEVA